MTGPTESLSWCWTCLSFQDSIDPTALVVASVCVPTLILRQKLFYDGRDWLVSKARVPHAPCLCMKPVTDVMPRAWTNAGAGGAICRQGSRLEWRIIKSVLDITKMKLISSEKGMSIFYFMPLFSTIGLSICHDVFYSPAFVWNGLC